jgi:drug/metabolite transporter (DMT)-like permease
VFLLAAVPPATLAYLAWMAVCLVAVVPFWMVGIERLRSDHEALASRRLVGLLVGSGGILLLVWPELDRTGGFLRGVSCT